MKFATLALPGRADRERAHVLACAPRGCPNTAAAGEAAVRRPGKPRRRPARRPGVRLPGRPCRQDRRRRTPAAGRGGDLHPRPGHRAVAVTRRAAPVPVIGRAGRRDRAVARARRSPGGLVSARARRPADRAGDRRPAAGGGPLFVRSRERVEVGPLPLDRTAAARDPGGRRTDGGRRGDGHGRAAPPSQLQVGWPAPATEPPPVGFPPPRQGRTRASDEWPRMVFGAGYALSYPLRTSAGASARHALALDVMVATRGHLEWDFGTDLAPSSDRTSTVASISVMDIPLRLGGRWVHQSGPLTVAVGSFLGVHWLSANASAVMQTDQRTAFGAVGGADLLVRGPVLAGFAPQARVWAEVNVPRTRFTIQGVPNYDVGAMRLGLTVEIVAPAP